MDTRLTISYILSVSLVFVASMLIFQRYQLNRVTLLQGEIKSLRQDLNAARETPIPPPQPAAAPATQNPGATEPAAAERTSTDSHIEQIRQQMAGVEVEIARLQNEEKTINDRSSSYGSQQTANVEGRKADIDRQITILSQALHDVDASIRAAEQNPGYGSPPDVSLPQLQDQRTSLQKQIDALNQQKRDAGAAGAAVNAQASAEATAEKEQVRLELGRLRQRLSDLQSELVQWQRKKATQENLQAE